MASEQHLAILKQGAQAWNRWRQAEPLVRPDLQGLSLTLADKQWGDTSGGPINLARALMRGANLRHATLIGCNLSNVDLEEGNLLGARLQNADLRNASLVNAYLEDADLEGALLDGADLRGADLSSARNLTRAQLETALGNAATPLPGPSMMPKAWVTAGAQASAPGVPLAPFPRPVPAKAPGEAPADAQNAAATEAERKAAQARWSASLAKAASLNRERTLARLSAPAAALPAATAEPKAAEWPRASAGQSTASWRHLARKVAVATVAVSLVALGLVALQLRHGGPIDAATLNENVPLSAEEALPNEEALQWLAIGEAKAPDVIEDMRVAEHVAPAADPGDHLALLAAEEGTPLGSIRAIKLEEGAAPTLTPETLAPKQSVRPLEESTKIVLAAEAVPGEPVTATDAHDGTLLARAIEMRTHGELRSQAPEPPTSVVAFLREPQKTAQWIKELISDYYLSSAALTEDEIRQLYSDPMDFFGEKQVGLERVAREKAQYYRHWPVRHYALVPASIVIRWKSADVADVTFLYDFEVSAPDKTVNKGRGRAYLTLDLKGRPGRIVREDGEVIAEEKPAAARP